MATPAARLSTQLLVQFLAAVAGCIDADSASRIAAERAAAALEAEVGAVVVAGVVVSAVGFPRDQIPREALVGVVERRHRDIEVPGLGVCAAMAAPLNDVEGGYVVVARSGGDGFAAEESNLLRGMARTLDLVLVMLRTLEAERAMRERSDSQAAENANLLEGLQGRHHLLEQLMGIQREISRRAPLDQVLESIVSGAYGLLGDELASLCLLDRDDPSRFVHVTSRGLPDATYGDAPPSGVAASRDVTAPCAAAWSAVERGVVAVAVAGPVNDKSPADVEGVATAMAAPVWENGKAVGALVVGSLSAGRAYLDADKATLAAFAEQVSLALTDARTLEDMRQAKHDSLTGLASRRLFMERLGQASNKAARDGSALALLFIDLDRFKLVNDTVGHSAGDRLLVEVANRLRSCMRADDSAARFGGDEFAVLLERLGSADQAMEVADRILRALREPIAIAGRQVFVDASIGIVSTRYRAGDREIDPESMMRDADVAMYQAKQAGAGRHALFEVGMRMRFQERVELEADLRQALERDELVLHYQPVIDLASGRTVSVEALVRWQHPVHGLVPPLSFIPIAEETGLIVALGEWVLRTACRQAQQWSAMLPPGTAPTLSVNLSGRQLQAPDLARQLARALDDSGLDAGLLTLEITESVFLIESRSTARRLHQLKQLGVKLAVDNFGAGYSSLRYLRDFPIDIVKIDKSFVDAIVTEPAAALLARAIIELGNMLGVQTVGEGIETAEQARLVRSWGCELGQGYYFSRPLAPPAIEAYLLHQGLMTLRPA